MTVEPNLLVLVPPTLASNLRPAFAWLDKASFNWSICEETSW
jgi:hypothetical protein